MARTVRGASDPRRPTWRKWKRPRKPRNAPENTEHLGRLNKRRKLPASLQRAERTRRQNCPPSPRRTSWAPQPELHRPRGLNLPSSCEEPTRETHFLARPQRLRCLGRHMQTEASRGEETADQHATDTAAKTRKDTRARHSQRPDRREWPRGYQGGSAHKLRGRDTRSARTQESTAPTSRRGTRPLATWETRTGPAHSRRHAEGGSQTGRPPAPALFRVAREAPAQAAGRGKSERHRDPAGRGTTVVLRRHGPENPRGLS